MDSGLSGKPSTENALVFDLKRCKISKLECQSKFGHEWTMKMGFSAENRFFITQEMKGFSSEWLHDEGIFRLQTYFFSSSKNVSLIIDFKYNSFQRFNMDVTDYPDTFDVTILFVTKHSPMFSSQRKNGRTQKFERQRCCYDDNANWNHLINATAFQISYKSGKNKFYSFMKNLLERLPCNVTFNEIENVQYKAPVENPLFLFFISLLPSNSKYYIECVQSLGTVGNFFLDYNLFENGDIRILFEYERLDQWDLINDYFCSMFQFLKKDISLLSLKFNPNDFPEKQKLDGHVQIRSVIITPTKILKEIDGDVSNNRAFRKLGPENILEVKLRDEDMSWFPRDKNLLESKVYNRLINGLTVAGKTFFEFGSSSSLFRDSGTYMLQAKNQEAIVKIINGWAEFKEEPAAKVASRVGLFLSSATEIRVKLRPNQIVIFEDFVTSVPECADDPPQYTFSDGIGIIDIEYARKIQAQLGLHYTPSAFQFRCLGCKGMVAVCPYNKNLVSNGGDKVVMFRDSQVKFKAFTEEDTEIDFDVIKYSAPSPLKLHRSFIALLIALARDQNKLESVEHRLHELFTSAFLDIIKSLFDVNAFSKTLNGLPKHFPVDKFRAEDLIQQEFFRSIIEANAVNLGKQLNSKCQIPLPENLGRSLLGVIDETGLLRANEVYIQYSNEILSKSPNQLKTVFCGRVGVTKSPMYHLGDIRYLNAVNIPELSHLVDVIVFSRRGERPIPDQIGGGDLDGDIYAVFWDPVFLLEHSEPANFPSPDTSVLQNVTVNELHHAHATFRKEYMELNNLEQISNIYMSHITLHHPQHPDVEKLAAKADISVNSFKSGIFAEPITPAEMPDFYPSFMNKRHEPSFDSDHVLNEIYKRCIRIYLLLQLIHHEKRKERLSKEKKNVEASNFAKDLYKKYCNELNILMVKFNIKTEAELFAGVNLDPVGNFNTFQGINRNKEATNNMIQESLRNIIGKFRTLILDRFKPDWKEDMIQRDENLTTYAIPYSEVPNAMKDLAKECFELANNDSTFLSFPYLVIEGLDFSFHTSVDSSVTNEINKTVSDFINTSFDYKNPSEREKPMALEGRLIQLSFSPVQSTLKEPLVHEKIISYPTFVISVPSFYSNGFTDNCEILKNISGCVDVAIRMRKNKGRFHYYTIFCNGDLKSCQKLEQYLTPYLKYDENITFAEMKLHKFRKMQFILKEIFGFTSPPSSPPHQSRHNLFNQEKRDTLKV